MVVVMVFNTTFNNISVISWRSVLLVGGNRSTRRKPPTCLTDIEAWVKLNAPMSNDGGLKIIINPKNILNNVTRILLGKDTDICMLKTIYVTLTIAFGNLEHYIP